MWMQTVSTVESWCSMLFDFLWMLAIVVTLIGAWKSLVGRRSLKLLERRVFVEERAIETGPIISGRVVDTEPLQRRIAARRKCEEVW